MRKFLRIVGVSFGTLFLSSVFFVAGCNIAGSKSEENAQIGVECAVDLRLTEKSGFVVDWNDVQQPWNSAIENDEIVFTRRGMCGDECAFEDRIVLSGISDDCPGFVSATTAITDQGGALGPATTVETATHGVLKIQDWDLEKGIFSGHLESEVVLTFYVSMSEEEQSK